MIYNNILEGIFISRPNRFIAHVQIMGQTHVCHVKNTGRCKELLIPGAIVYVQEAENPQRKTKYDLISVYKGKELINMDSNIPNKVFAEWARGSGYFGKNLFLKPEVSYGNSRFDFYMEAGEEKGYVEVKGVTLEENGVALFPDAPTERGLKHVEELIACRQASFFACAVFIIQMKGVHSFLPNDTTQPAFGQALHRAKEAGVHILALDCIVTKDSIRADSPVHCMGFS